MKGGKQLAHNSFLSRSSSRITNLKANSAQVPQRPENSRHLGRRAIEVLVLLRCLKPSGSGSEVQRRPDGD